MTKEAAQRSIWTFYEAVKVAELNRERLPDPGLVAGDQERQRTDRFLTGELFNVARA